ncbi:sodium/potassium-transporting ATPase subunit beta-2-like [Ixodes scapularis]|uniref:sodium/potassium-transporting ATPase subunit beta-2-like n=1 Tax=Ixodes scapularis TaxID=6945 RepID=UPI001A9DFBD0|nr:sodium/potassium-transporting ATPase subunit beta-2-like [Ixodes scapularis]
MARRNQLLGFFVGTLTVAVYGQGPGLSVRPNQPEHTANSTLIYIRTDSQNTWKHWVDDLNEYLADYQSTGANSEHLRLCDFTHPLDPDENKSCFFSLDPIANDCSAANNFGYDRGQPCILLKLNRTLGWVPEPYENGSFPAKLPKYIQDDYDPRYVYISCDGENPADKENVGPLVYYPNLGIPNYYFPYRNTPGYQSPFIFVRFPRPQRGVIISVECKAWAKNIHHDQQGRVGSVHFELLID